MLTSILKGCAKYSLHPPTRPTCLPCTGHKLRQFELDELDAQNSRLSWIITILIVIINKLF